MKNKKQENEVTTTHKQIVNGTVIIKPIKKKEVIGSDTLVIQLKKINFSLLDVRLNDVDKRELIIVKNNSIQHKMNLLTGEDYMGFSINYIKDIGQGFEISTEFGKFYISRNFQFTYQNNSFFLTKIETHSIDYRNNNKKKEEIKIIEKPISIDEFRMEDFID
jgi:hypothetical protein